MVGQLEGEQKMVEQMQAWIHKLLTFPIGHFEVTMSLVQKNRFHSKKPPPEKSYEIYDLSDHGLVDRSG